jgi:hypothetical protein
MTAEITVSPEMTKRFNWASAGGAAIGHQMLDSQDVLLV